MSNIKSLFDVIFHLPGASLPLTGIFSAQSLLLFDFIFLLFLFILIIKKISAFYKSEKSKKCPSDNLMRPQKKNKELAQQLEEIKNSTNKRNNYISSLFSAMDSGVILFEADKSIVLFNESAKRLARIDSRCFFYPEDILSNRVMAAVFRQFDEVLKKRTVFTLKLKNLDGKDLEIGISPVLSKYRDGALLGVLVILKDITEQEKVERIRREFISNVSHEFRTPLTLISGFIETLKMWEDLPAKDRNRSLEILEIETGRLSKLISELLLLSEIEHKIDTTSTVPIDATKSIEQAIESLRELFEAKHQKIESNIDLRFPLLYGNESWFYHAFRNIFENAIKYTPEGGSITVSAESDTSSLRISVRDTGIGIPEEEHAKIFERFYRVEKARSSKSGGSGIGLAIVKDIMSLFGGRIEVKSFPGRGSTFTLVFPLQGEPQAKESANTGITTQDKTSIA